MHYSQDISACFDDQIGPHGLARAAFEKRLTATDGALKTLRAAYKDSSLELLRICEARDDLANAGPAAERFLKGASDVFLFGTGGSSLGAQALAQLVGFGTPGFFWGKGEAKGAKVRLHFFDNLDPKSLAEALANLDLKTSRFLVVSKSGGTPETMSQMLVALAALDQAGEIAAAKDRFLVVTEPKPSAMLRLAQAHGLPTLDHPLGIGGRYSALSIVGLLPALLMGLDAAAIREGAASVLKPVLDGAPPKDVAPALGAALAVALNEEKRISISVLMPYLDRLERFAMWYRQLWAESIGKNGKGTTPVRALGPVDQHSQVQLYLDGPRDKVYTLMMGDIARSGPKIPAAMTRGDADLAYLANRTIGDLADAEQRATAVTLAKNGRPVRVMRVPKLDERAMGALMMHFMLETIIAAHLMGVDPYDQPAVEQGKILTKQYLKESAG